MCVCSVQLAHNHYEARLSTAISGVPADTLTNWSVTCTSSGVVTGVSDSMSVTVSAVPLTINQYSGTAVYDTVSGTWLQPASRPASGSSSLLDGTLTINTRTPDIGLMAVCEGITSMSISASDGDLAVGTNLLAIHANGAINNIDSALLPVFLTTVTDNGPSDTATNPNVINTHLAMQFVTNTSTPGPHFEVIKWTLDFSTGGSATHTTDVDFRIKK